jgi:hypothetical protein
MMDRYLIKDIIEKPTFNSEIRKVINRATGEERVAKIFKKADMD